MDYIFLATQEFGSDDFLISFRQKLKKLEDLEKEKVTLESWLQRYYDAGTDDADSGNEEDRSDEQQEQYEERLEILLEEIIELKEEIDYMVNNVE